MRNRMKDSSVNIEEQLAEVRAAHAALVAQVAEQSAMLNDLRITRTQRAIRLMRTKKRLIVTTLVCFVGIPLLHAAVPHTFTAGTAAVAADVNANFTYLDEISVPVGGIIGWHKSFTNVPALPASGKWVECNGQVLADAGSALNGQTIPNLNGAAGGADSPGHAAKVAMFLRGGETSGTGQQDAFQGHEHRLRFANTTTVPAGTHDNSYGVLGAQNTGRELDEFNAAGERWTSIETNGINGTPRTANETRPSNMAVVWIMRVK
jgi:hypothetical protein